MIKKIFEDDNFILYKDNKGFDFAYDIEIKNKNKIKTTIILNSSDEKIQIYEWLGLFENEKYIIENIINNNYKVVE